MIRRNGDGSDESHARQRNSDGSDLWRVNPWLTSHMIGAAHSQCSDAAEQERDHALFAALGEPSAATIADVGRELEKEHDEKQQQAAALSNWEDEGGSTAASASLENIKAATA